jgi:hypothetical protein
MRLLSSRARKIASQLASATRTPSRAGSGSSPLQRLAERAKLSWDRLEADHRDPSAQLRAWLKDMATHVASGDERGCPLANAAVELPEKDHPARRVIEAFKTAQRERLVELRTAAALAEPDMLADELFLLLEGARVAAQSIGPHGLVTGS